MFVRRSPAALYREWRFVREQEMSLDEDESEDGNDVVVDDDDDVGEDVDSHDNYSCEVKLVNSLDDDWPYEVKFVRSLDDCSSYEVKFVEALGAPLDPLIVHD